jgi:glycerate-2-kinase
LSGGTDGEDGNVPVAGAVIDQTTIAQVCDSNLLDLAKAALIHHDAFSFLNSLNATLVVEPTKTNVCDLRVVVVS